MKEVKDDSKLMTLVDGTIETVEELLSTLSELDTSSCNWKTVNEIGSLEHRLDRLISALKEVRK